MVFIMDNVASKAIKKFVGTEHLGLQLVKSHNHHVNAVEYVIQTLKVIIAMLCVTDQFPLHFLHKL